MAVQMMIKGESIKLFEKTQNGFDDFGQPIYTESAVTINNVLIGSPSSDDVTSEITLSDKKIVYSLGIPKGDTHTWEDRIVEIRSRKYHTVGIATEYTEGNMPNWWAWNKQIRVECYE